MFLIISCWLCLSAQSQQWIDTSYSVRGFNCQCKYNLNTSDDSKIFNRNQTAAYYPGGEEEWKKFVKKNMGRFKGSHDIQFRFQVDKNGNTSEFLLLNEAPDEKFREIIRLVSLSGKWFPGTQGGYCIKSFVRMMLTL